LAQLVNRHAARRPTFASPLVGEILESLRDNAARVFDWI
jgi:hypothetical protein